MNVCRVVWSEVDVLPRLTSVAGVKTDGLAQFMKWESLYGVQARYNGSGAHLAILFIFRCPPAARTFSVAFTARLDRRSPGPGVGDGSLSGISSGASSRKPGGPPSSTLPRSDW